MFPVERVPDKIGAYSVVKYIGRNGASDVYVARMDGPMGFQRTVTLKVVPLTLEDDPRFADELAREATICSKLNHTAVARMFDFFEHQGRLVLVLEQVEGASLEKLTNYLGRRKVKLSDGAILFIGAEIAGALAHAHTLVDESGSVSPVIHRNIQPENIYVTWDGRVRLAGFGLGKILGRTPDSVVGTVSGTPGYMSPEQARGERATVRSDVYGLGAVLWSLFADLEPPRDGAPLQSLAELRDDLPKDVAAAIDEAIDPVQEARRISSAELKIWIEKLANVEQGKEELRQRVSSFRSARDVVDSPRAAPRPTKPKTRRRQGAGAARTSMRRSAFPPSSRPPSRSLNWARPISTAAPSLDSEPPTKMRGGSSRSPSSGPGPSARPGPSAGPGSNGRLSQPPGGPGPYRLGPGIPRPPPLPGRLSPGDSEAPSSERSAEDSPSQSRAWDREDSPSQSRAWDREDSPSQSRAWDKEDSPSRSRAWGGDDPPSKSRAWQPLYKPTTKTEAEDGSTRITLRPPSLLAPPPDESTAIRSMSGIPAHLIAAARKSAGSIPAPPGSTKPPPRPQGFVPKALAESTFSRLSSALLEAPISSGGLSEAPKPLVDFEWPQVPLPLPEKGPLVRVSDASDEANTSKNYRIRGGQRRSNGLAQVLIAAITAGIVVVIGMLVIERVQAPTSAVASSEKPQAGTKPANQEVAPDPRPRTEEPVAPTPKTNGASSDTQQVDGHTTITDVDLSRLSDQLGYLTVKNAIAADVYVNGINKGATNQPLVVPCGQWFLRLASPSPGRFPTWLGRGETVSIPCRTATTIDVEILPDPPAPFPKGAGVKGRSYGL